MGTKQKNKIEYFEKNYSGIEKDTLLFQIVGFGESQTSPSQAPTQTSDAYYNFHLCVSGCGYVKLSNGTITKLKAGDMFFTYPRMHAHYYPDKKNPWHYYWINFSGNGIYSLLNKIGISKEHPFIRLKKLNPYKNLLVQNLKDHCLYKDMSSVFTRATLYNFFTMLIKETYSQEKKKPLESDHVAKVLLYIEQNYSDPELSLKKLANVVSLNETYLSRLFCKVVGLPLKQYLNNFRVQRACSLFSEGETSIKNVAFSVGFTSQYYFSKVFSSIMEEAPSLHVKALKELKEATQPSKNKE